jgi:hypothetical protein
MLEALVGERVLMITRACRGEYEEEKEKRLKESGGR